MSNQALDVLTEEDIGVEVNPTTICITAMVGDDYKKRLYPMSTKAEAVEEFLEEMNDELRASHKRREAL